MGASDGQPRQHIDPWDQIEDYKNAITYAENLPEIDPARIGIWGISYSGGHVLIVAATDPRVKSVVSNVPVIDGYQTMWRMHGTTRFRKLNDLVLEERRKRTESGTTLHAHVRRAETPTPSSPSGPTTTSATSSTSSRPPKPPATSTATPSRPSNSSCSTTPPPTHPA